MGLQLKREKIAAYVASALFALVVLASGLQLPTIAQRVVGAVPAVVVALFWFFDQVVWRVPIVARLCRRPDLRGTWTGTLTSIRRDHEDRLKTTVHPIAVVVVQTFTSIAIKLISEQSTSRSLSATLLTLPGDDFELLYQYENTPTVQFRVASPIHAGSTRLSISGTKPAAMQGEYWTSRSSHGELKLRFADRTRSGSFDEAIRKQSSK